MRITEQEHDIRKKRMIHAAYELFCQYGIDSVSIAQISKSAGVSSNSIFRYFYSKAALVQCTQTILWEEIVSRILTSSKEEISRAQNGLEEIKILLSNFEGLYENNSKFLLFACDYKLFLVRNHIKLSVKAHDKMMEPIHSTFTSALKRGHEDGSIYRSDTVLNQFYAMWGVMRGFVEEIVVYDQMYDGKNPWRGRFGLVLNNIVASLETERST